MSVHEREELFGGAALRRPWGSRATGMERV
jgi:hypothetical protein